ncbi:MAG: hypothetical protein NHB14_20815 [Desulfosporosinus sp.]|nr:hypothetical protein [Desulfosporosinus sp.]
MVVVRGTISEDQVREWLENWLSLAICDKMPDALPANSGAKAFDGISGARINKIMMEDAIKKLPIDLQRVVHFRWTGPKVKLRDALICLGYGKSEYYRRCDLAVIAIYRIINGLALNYANLWDRIHRDSDSR